MESGGWGVVHMFRIWVISSRILKALVLTLGSEFYN
jgi:hypothetical protein